jgi:branched-chain amino acid transport system substrate-binding protein
VAETSFITPKEGGLPASVAKRTKVTVATLDPAEYPPEGQKFFEEYEKKYGDKTPDPYGIYGYEAGRLALDAIKKSGTGSKEDVLKAIFETKDRKSVLGTYSIDKNGDTTLTDYGVYGIKDGELDFEETIKPSGN